MKTRKISPVKILLFSVATILFVGGCTKAVHTNPSTTTTTTTIPKTLSFGLNDHTPCLDPALKGPVTNQSGAQVYEFCGPTTSTTVRIPSNLRTSGTRLH